MKRIELTIFSAGGLQMLQKCGIRPDDEKYIPLYLEYTKMLEQMYDRMTDEEKRLFAMLSMQNKSNDEILRAIQQNQQHLQHLVEHTDRDQWYKAFGSDVAANVLTTSAFWLLGKLFAKR